MARAATVSAAVGRSPHRLEDLRNVTDSAP
jgi:hypothetical protein